MRSLNNIVNTKGVATSATELSGKAKTGQPAKDDMVQREEEEEAEEQEMEKRRVERREERALHTLLQGNKQERDLEKAIQAKDDLVQEEKDEEIMEEFDEIFDEAKKVVKVKRYWNEPLPEGKMSRAPLDKSAQIRLQMKKKINGPGRGHPLRALKGRIHIVKRRRGVTQGRSPLKSDIRPRVGSDKLLTVLGQRKKATKIHTCWYAMT